MPGCSSPGCLCPANDGGTTTCPKACSANLAQDCPYACSPVFTGTLAKPTDTHCSVHKQNLGCGVKGPSGSFGPTFNSAHGTDGAVFSLYWKKGPGDANYTAFYFIADRAVIDDTTKGPFGSDPDMTSWGQPYAVMDATSSGNRCIMQNLQLIINIAICGQWPEPALGGSTACAALAHGGLPDAYFEFGRLALMDQQWV